MRSSLPASPVPKSTTDEPAAESSQLLSAREELALVTELGALRANIERLMQPLKARASDDARIDHFDQLVIYYESLPSVRPKLKARIDQSLVKYQRIRHRLALANIAWVTKLARGQRLSVLSEEDLFQEGMCGLLKAIDRFEPERGLRLMTYATWYIREAMQQVRARQSHLVCLSAHDHSLLARVDRQRADFLHRHDRSPSLSELGHSIDRQPAALGRLQAATNPPISLDRGLEGAIPVAVDDPALDWEEWEDRRATIRRLLDTLPDRERTIVSRRFGLEGRPPESLEALGDDLNVCKERVRQLQRQAIQRMRDFAGVE